MYFLYPNVLLFMLLPLLILAFLITTNKTNIEKHFKKESLDKLRVNSKTLSKTSRNILFFISIILMIIALARPVLDKKNQEIKQETISFLIALDVSNSMKAIDIKPNRLALAKKKLEEFVNLSKDKAIAVVLFSNSSYILSPLTQDFISLKQMIKNINTNMNFDKGSDIMPMLKTSKKLLKNAISKNIILLTDGLDKTSFKDEIEFANKNNLNVYTILIANEKPAPIKLDNGDYLSDENGNIVNVKANEEVKQLSFKTNAAFIKYNDSNSDIKAILNQIEKNSSKNSLKNKNFKVYTELFYYPLALGIFVLLIAFSSLPKFRFLILFCAICFFNQKNIYADVFDFQTINSANKAYENKDFKKASKEYKKLASTNEAKYNLANSFYKEKKYQQALNEYKKVITSNDDLEFRKLHNLGNTYTKLNDLQSAIKMYEKALKIKEDKQTRKNLELVKKAMKKQENKKNKENKQKNKKSKKEQKKQEQKEKKQKQDNKSNKEKKQDKNKQDKKKQDNKSKKPKEDKQKKQNKAKDIKNIPISKLEEKKWLKKLDNQTIQVLLKKDEKSNEKGAKW